MSRSSRHVQQHGVTLVELMVAMVIGLLLTAGAIQIFLTTQETSRFQESLSRIQETGRYAVATFARDLRGTDYRGCTANSIPEHKIQNLLDDDDAGSEFFEDGLTGHRYSDGWQPELPAELAEADPAPAENGDVLILRTSNQAMARISGHGVKGKNIFVHDAESISDGDIVMASDCSRAAIFQVTPGGAGNNKGNSSGQKGEPLGYNSGNKHDPGNRNVKIDDNLTGGNVTRVTQHAYYIAPSDSGQGPALFRKSLPDGDAEELAAGVERLRFEFGEDTSGDGDVDAYRRADSVNNWGDVLTVRANVLVRGNEDNVVDEPQAVTFPADADNTIRAEDRRLRQVYTTTVTLRNRMP